MRTVRDRAMERLAGYLPVRRRVTELEDLPPGPALITALRELRGTPMTEELALRCVALWERCRAWLDAQCMTALGEADRVGPDERPLLAEEVAALTHTSFASALGLLTLTQQVAESLGCAWTALERGQLTLGHVKALGRAVERCPADVAQRIDEALVPIAVERAWTPSELGRAAHRAVIKADPDGAANRATRAKANSDVRLYAGKDDMAGLAVDGEAALLRLVMDGINQRAAQLQRGGDDRPIGLRRVAALADAVLGEGVTQRPAVHALVTIDLTTLLGLTQHPGELSGYGPITADLARLLATDAALRRLVTDPITGTVIDVGRRSYRPSKLIRQIVEAIHPTCQFPGCSRRAIECDCDHRTDWREGGHTSTENLHPLCRRHHNLKTRKLWRVDINPDGSEVWTSRLGFRFVKHAATYPVDLLEPPPEDELPDDFADRLPEHDPDPPFDDIPLPEAPPLTEEEFEEFSRAIDALDVSAHQAAERSYDEWRRLQLTA